MPELSHNPDTGSTGAMMPRAPGARQNGTRPPRPRFSITQGRAAGFTILELLVSVAVLALLVAVVSMIVGSASKVVKPSVQRMDSESQARLVFDRMANDFAKMVKRNDADYLFYSGAGNDAMFFYSEAPGYYDDSNTARSKKSNLALIGYRINTANAAYPNTPVLERLGLGLTWDGSNSAGGPGGPVFLTANAAAANPAVPDPATTLAGNWGGSPATPLGTLARNYSDGRDPYASGGDPGSYHVLSDLVFRMEIQFLLTDGTLSVLPLTNQTATKNNLTANAPPTVTDDADSGYSPGSRWFDSSTNRGYLCTKASSKAATWNLIGMQDISAIVVTLAVLDSNSRKIITGNLSSAALVDAASGTPVAKTWMDYLNNPANIASASGIPLPAAAQVRVYQRTFYLANP